MDREKNQQPELMVSLSTIAAEWGCSRSTVKRALDRAQIKPYVLGVGKNGTLRYKRSDLDRFLESCRSQKE